MNKCPKCKLKLTKVHKEDHIISTCSCGYKILRAKSTDRNKIIKRAISLSAEDIAYVTSISSVGTFNNGIRECIRDHKQYTSFIRNLERKNKEH